MEDNNDIYLWTTAEQCVAATATLTDQDLLYLDQFLQFPSPPIATEFISCHTPATSPTALQEISSHADAAIKPTVEPTATSLQYADLLYDSVVNFSESPKAEAGSGRWFAGRPEPDLAEKKKKQRFWTKDEHMLFVIGEEMYGKGNWKDIATKLVLTKTPTQVASHAQKFYQYHENLNSKHRIRTRPRSRSSIFDITTVDPHLKARLLAVQLPSPPLPPSSPQQFTVTNYYPPPHH